MWSERCGVVEQLSLETRLQAHKMHEREHMIFPLMISIYVKVDYIVLYAIDWTWVLRGYDTPATAGRITGRIVLCFQEDGALVITGILVPKRRGFVTGKGWHITSVAAASVKV